MPLPAPPTSLDNSCSAIFNNTLYTYSSSAFQSLSLVKGATWTTMAPGVSVEGGACVKSTPVNNSDAAALWIVGGVASSSSYKGLQKFTFSTGKWASIEPNVAVTQNRLWHSAVYLNQSDSILVYAGTQDGAKKPTSQTFTINATEPYSVLAYEANSPPAIQPELIPYSQSKALMVGGSETNTKMMLFSPSSGWQDSKATLASPFYNSTNIHAIIINGDDSSKSLYTFDMTKSPNQVNRTIFEDADGNPVQQAVPVVEKGAKAAARTTMEKRGDLTVQDWPTYNNTLAPSTTRTAYSVARDQSGLTVFSGGNADDVLCIFRARKNTWVNATQMLVQNPSDQSFGITSIPTTSSALSSSTPTGTAPAVASSTTAAANATTPKNSDPPLPTTILGAVLGSILGVAFILIAVLVFLRWRRRRKHHNELGHQRRSSGLPTDEKNTMDFMDRGLPQMSSARAVPGHQANPSDASFSSVAILMGRMGHNRNSGEGNLVSDTSSQFNKPSKASNISKPMAQDLMPPVKEVSSQEKVIDPKRPPLTNLRGMPSRVRGSTRRSSGWNRYWSGGSSMNILGFGGSKRTTMEEGARDSAVSAYSDSRRSGLTHLSQHSAMPTPLKVPFPGQPELNRVNSGSPTLAVHSSSYPLTREMTGKIERPGSGSSFSSYTDDRLDQFSSGIPASVNEQHNWTPMDERNNYAPSLAYTDSVYAPTIARDTRQFPQGIQFPQPPPQRPPPPHSSDMSWLNLGNGQAHDRI